MDLLAKITICNFKHIQKESEKVPGYATTNGDIVIKPAKSGEVFFRVEAKFNFGSLSSVNNFSFEKSKTGGITSYSTGVSMDKETGELKVLFFEDHLNCITLTSLFEEPSATGEEVKGEAEA